MAAATDAGGLRAAMPEVAAFIDAAREAFGRDGVDAAIRAGLRGEPGFYAEENGHQVGTPLPPAQDVFRYSEATGRWERR